MELLFLGDSLTARGLWNEFIPEKSCLNRGIGSDTTEGVKNRIKEIISRNPQKLFLMIGINDLAKNIRSDEIVSNVRVILSTLSNETTAEIYLQSILPCLSVALEDIESINQRYCELADEYQNVTYVDLYESYLENGNLNKKLYSDDGIHLNGKGYEIWLERINPYFNK